MGKKVESLTESYFYILLCLANGPNHGYGIMQRTKELSAGEVKIGSGTMYGATGNMTKKGWIVESKGSTEDSDRRRMYTEIRRLRRLLAGAEEVLEGK